MQLISNEMRPGSRVDRVRTGSETRVAHRSRRMPHAMRSDGSGFDTRGFQWRVAYIFPGGTWECSVSPGKAQDTLSYGPEDSPPRRTPPLLSSHHTGTFLSRRDGVERVSFSETLG